MNTQLQLTICNINTICICVTIIVFIISLAYVLCPVVLSYLEHKPSKVTKVEKPSDDPEIIAIKLEIQRQDRVRALMREICELTNNFNPDITQNGLYNDEEARKLFKLYQEIDEHIKLSKTDKEDE